MRGQIGKDELAIHVVWALNPDQSGYWMVGFSPETHILSASAEIQQLIVAGRCRQILVIVDGPMPKEASEMRIDIDSPDGATFKVTVTE